MLLFYTTISQVTNSFTPHIAFLNTHLTLNIYFLFREAVFKHSKAESRHLSSIWKQINLSIMKKVCWLKIHFKKMSTGTSQQSSGKDSALPLQGGMGLILGQETRIPEKRKKKRGGGRSCLLNLTLFDAKKSFFRD